MALKQREVSSQKIEEELPSPAISDVAYRTCVFCEKMVRICGDNFNSCVHLSRTHFFCPFCLRNNFHYRSSRNVLVFSYRAIFGYYYLHNYRKNKGRQVYLNQIENYIRMHEKIGLRQPAFCYDPDTYLWFADFNKIGVDGWKAPFDEVITSARWILLCLGLEDFFGKSGSDIVWERYEKAFKVFYEQRQRPADRRMLIPTLKGVGFTADEVLFEETRNFIPQMLILK